MQTEVKTLSAEFREAKRSEDGKRGIVKMFVAVTGNIDSSGDRIMPGAFDEDLAAWQAKGDQIPVVYSHQWDAPRAHVGVVQLADEREIDGKRGLYTEQLYDLDLPPEQSDARQVFHLLEQRRMTKASFAYTVLEYKLVEPVDDESTPRYDGFVRELHKLRLYEVGPTLVGANQETELLEAAAAGAPGDGDQQDEGAEAEGEPKNAADAESGDTCDTLAARVIALRTRPRHGGRYDA